MNNLYRDLLDAPQSFRITANERTVEAVEFKALISSYRSAIFEGSKNGERVGIPLQSQIDALAMAYACFGTGRTAVFLPSDPEYQSHIINDAAVRFVFDKPGSAESVAKIETTEPALIIYTSGTTSNMRKGVLIRHDCISNCSSFMNEAMGVTPEIKELLFAPIDHLYGFGRCHAVLTAGGWLRLAGTRSNFTTILQALKTGTNSLAVVPSVLAGILQAAKPQLQSLGNSVRWIQTGAMRLDQQFRSEMLQIFPNAYIGMHYGLTEVMRATWLDLRKHPDKLHTEGRPRPGVRVELRDDSNQKVPDGHEGEICISGDAVAEGYTNHEEWKKRLTPDRWYRSGDLGLIDEEGFLLFRGRSDDILNINGYLVHPGEIDSRLSTLIKEPFCVVGIPDPRGLRDTVIVICVEGNVSYSTEDIADHLASSPSHFRPSYVLSIPELPRTITGKLKRKEITKFARAKFSIDTLAQIDH